MSRVQAEDGCQLTGKRPSAKYALTGGQSSAGLTAALRRYGTDPGSDAPLLFRWAVANLALGNRDAYANNVSILRTADRAVRLAPAYDVVCSMAYTSLNTVMPLPFGGAQHVSQLHEGGGPVSLCVYCVHKITFTSNCAAYPNGIPSDLTSGHAAHLTPTGDDNGIVFEVDEFYGKTVGEVLEIAGPDSYKAFLKRMDEEAAADDAEAQL